MTRADIQALIDALPSVGALPTGTQVVGGTVDVPAGTHVLDGPLLMDNCVWLRGSGSDCLIQYNHLTDAPIHIHTRAGHGYCKQQRVSDMNIYNTLGPTIRMDSTSTTEWSDIHLHDLNLAAGGDCINLISPSGETGNHPKLERIYPLACGGQPVRIKARHVRLQSVQIVNCTKAGLHPTEALIEIDGSGHIIHCWLESSRGCPLLRLFASPYNGAFVLFDNHNEPHQDTDDGVDYQIVLDGVDCQADEFYFAGPKNPVYLKNGSELTCTRKLRTDLNGGPTDPRTCYLSDGHVNNRVIYEGKAYLGRQINPTASIPARRQ